MQGEERGPHCLAGSPGASQAARTPKTGRPPVFTPSGRWPAGDPILNLPQQRSSSQGNIGARKVRPLVRKMTGEALLCLEGSPGAPQGRPDTQNGTVSGASPPSGRRPSQILRTILKRDGGALRISPVWLKTVEIHSMLKKQNLQIQDE